MAKRSMSERVRRDFNHSNIEVVDSVQEIRVYFLRDPQGREWVPYGGGPLYRQQAIDSAAWLARHIEKFRDLLPKSIRQYKIVFGELNTRTFPGKFYPSPLPPEPVETTYRRRSAGPSEGSEGPATPTA